MIDPNFLFCDINPYTWRNLGEVMNYLLPPKTTLYILHENGIVKRAVFSDNTLCPLNFSDYDPDTFSAQTFFQLYPNLDEVHVLELSALIHYYTVIQTVSLDEKTSMEYLDFITDCYASHKGIDLYFRDKQDCHFYRKALSYARTHFWDRQILLFIVTKSGYIWFDAVLLFQCGRIMEVRTLETLDDPRWYTQPLSHSEDSVKLLGRKFHCPVKKNHCEYDNLSFLTDFWKHYHISN